MLKFFYNGIKDADGRLQKCLYGIGPYKNFPNGTICIHNREYNRFSEGITKLFSVKNDSDSQSDYFETDHFFVVPNHPLYQQVYEAMKKAYGRTAKKQLHT